MIAIQLLLSFGLLAACAYAFVSRALLKSLSLLIYAASLVGLWFVWSPDHANSAAHALGVGRGADLLLYCWVVVSAVVLLNLHLKLRASDRRMTELAREMALQAPLKPREVQREPRDAQRIAAE